MENDLASTTEAASILGVSPQRVRQLLGEGRLVGTRIGRDWLIERQQLEAFKATPRKRTGRPRKVLAQEQVHTVNCKAVGGETKSDTETNQT